MRLEISCPTCKAILNVPEAVLGKKVRCAKCKAVFVAEDPAALDQLEEIPDDLPEAIREEAIQPEPRRRKRPPQPIEQEPEEEEQEEEEPRPRKRRRKRRGNVWSRVETPGLFLMIVGYVGGALTCLWLIADVVLVFVGPKDMDTDHGALAAGAIVGDITKLVGALVWSGIVINSAICMRALRSHSTAVGGSIVAMLPCNCGCCLGIPIGIWCLVVLMDPAVKKAFR